MNFLSFIGAITVGIVLAVAFLWTIGYIEFKPVYEDSEEKPPTDEEAPK